MALVAEKIHTGMYQNTKQAVENGKDVRLDDVYICDACGYTIDGEAPDRCSICDATRERFGKF